MLFHEMSNFLTVVAEKFLKTQNHDSLCKKLLGLAESMICYALSPNEPLFGSFGRKVAENARP